MVDWPLHGKELGLIERQFQPSVQRLLWRKNTCMVKMRQDGKRVDGECPLCGGEDSSEHFAACPELQKTEELRRVQGKLGSNLRRRMTLPVIAMWVMSVAEGERPILEDERRFRSAQIIKRAYRRQESVGWENLAKGRAVRGMVEVQEEWDERGESASERREDARETVARALTYGLLFRHEMWKVRCQEVMKVELLIERRKLQERIEELIERRTEVGV